MHSECNKWYGKYHLAISQSNCEKRTHHMIISCYHMSASAIWYLSFEILIIARSEASAIKRSRKINIILHDLSCDKKFIIWTNRRRFNLRFHLFIRLASYLRMVKQSHIALRVQYEIVLLFLNTKRDVWISGILS